MKIMMVRKAILQVALLALGMTALSAVPARAQDPSTAPTQDQAGPRHGGRGGPGRQVDFLTKKLNLTPDQVTQVKALDADTMTQMRALRSDTSLTPDEKKPKMMDLHKASQDKIRALLTPDQQTKFDALQAQMKERRGNRGGGQGSPPPPPPSTPQP